MLVLLMWAACSGDKMDSGTTGSGTTDSGSTDSGTTDSGTTPACMELTSGEDWAWNGECPQMRTPCVVTFADCAVTIDYPSGMTMNMPNAGTVDGDTITFTGGGFSGCTGTITDATHITGGCDDGCTFTLQVGR